jgi:dehydratase
VDAPDSVEHAADFKIVIKPFQLTVPQYIQGRKVVEVTRAQWYLQLPTNATFHGAFITDGSGIGGAYLDQVDNGLVLTVDAYLAGGETFQFPEITLKVEADFPDTEIVTRLAGTSFDDYGLHLDTKIQGMSGRIYDVSVSCYPDQGVVLSTTTVGSENNNNNNNNNNGQHGNDQNKPQKPHKPKPQNPHKPHHPCKPKPHRPHEPCV